MKGTCNVWIPIRAEHTLVPRAEVTLAKSMILVLLATPVWKHNLKGRSVSRQRGKFIISLGLLQNYLVICLSFGNHRLCLQSWYFCYTTCNVKHQLSHGLSPNWRTLFLGQHLLICNHSMSDDLLTEDLVADIKGWFISETHSQTHNTRSFAANKASIENIYNQPMQIITLTTWSRTWCTGGEGTCDTRRWWLRRLYLYYANESLCLPLYPWLWATDLQRMKITCVCNVYNTKQLTVSIESKVLKTVISTTFLPSSLIGI